MLELENDYSELKELLNSYKIDPKFWDEIIEAPSDIRAELLDLSENIEMVSWMLSPPEVRGYAKDRPKMNIKEGSKYTQGRIEVDITKPHILEDMDYFRQPAIHFQKYGKYTNLYPNPHPKSAYKQYWDEEMRRCKFGYDRPSDGEWIPGYYYWYLNYFPIIVSKVIDEDGTRGERELDFPDVWDSDYMFFHYVEQGEENSLYGAILKTRGRGYSFKVAAMLCRNFYLYKKSKGFAFAAESEFLTKDGILNKAWDGMEFLDEHTPWKKLKQKKDTQDHKKASYIDAEGQEKGYKSEILAVTTKGNPEKGRGKRGKLLIHEEAGIYPGLLQTWNIARPSIEDGPITFGYQICFGTGGTIGAKFEGLEELFYNGGGYRVKMLRNVWDKVKGQGTCGYYVPEYMNRKTCYDANGNSNVGKALQQILYERKLIRENATKENALTQEKAERSCISKNTIVSNTSIGSNQITLFDNYFNNGQRELFELNTIYGRKLECTNDHEIYDGEKYKEAKDFKIGDRIKLKEFIPNKDYVYVDIQGKLNFQKYKIKIDEDFARMLGLYMGDGCFHKDSIEFSFDNRDTESINWLSNYFEKTFTKPIVTDCYPSKMTKVKVNSKELKSIFKQMDLLQKWNGNKHGYKRKVHVPLYIFQSPKSVIAAFLQGYFDSDGGVYSSLKNIRVYAKFKIILEQVQVLLSAFGIFSKIVSQKKVNGEGRIFTGNAITLKSWEVDLFTQIGFISQRKQQMLEKWTQYESKVSDKNYGYDFIKSFDSIGVQEVYDIKTDEGCYSANGIWVHNCTPQEAVMRIEGTLFPVDDLKSHLESILPEFKSFVSEHYIGTLVAKGGTTNYEFFPKADAQVIREFPLKDNVNKEGAIEIFEMPVKNGMGEIPKYRYLLSGDPIDDDSSTTNSLASVFVFDILTDRIVAEYTGRPKTANQYYEICLRLCKFYNGILNYENDRKGLYAYFFHANALTYLCDNPEILKDMDLVKANGLYGNKKKGTNSGVKINAWGRRLQADWMVRPAYGHPDKLNLHMIRSIGYLKEAIAWNPDINADRVSAMGMMMILREEYLKYKLQIQEDSIGKKTKTLADDPFFTNNFGKGKASQKVSPQVRAVIREKSINNIKT